MKITQFVGLGAILALTACAPPPPPPAIQGEVIMNKYGQPTGCVDGMYIPGAPYEQQCLPPPDDCDPSYTAGSNYNDCYPYREPEGGNGDRDPNGNTISVTTGGPVN
jgi:hypothetical protein